MCQVRFHLSGGGSPALSVELKYCRPLRERYDKLPQDWHSWVVRSEFCWSPMGGCEGLVVTGLDFQGSAEWPLRTMGRESEAAQYRRRAAVRRRAALRVDGVLPRGHRELVSPVIASEGRIPARTAVEGETAAPRAGFSREQSVEAARSGGRETQSSGSDIEFLPEAGDGQRYEDESEVSESFSTEEYSRAGSEEWVLEMEDGHGINTSEDGTGLAIAPAA